MREGMREGIERKLKAYLCGQVPEDAHDIRRSNSPYSEKHSDTSDKHSKPCSVQRLRALECNNVYFILFVYLFNTIQLINV